LFSTNAAGRAGTGRKGNFSVRVQVFETIKANIFLEREKTGKYSRSIVKI